MERKGLDGDWEKPGTHEACCDCGAVHKLEYQLVAMELQARWTFDKELTKEMRQRQNIKDNIKKLYEGISK